VAAGVPSPDGVPIIYCILLEEPVQYETPFTGNVQGGTPPADTSRGIFVRTRGAARAGLTMGSTLAMVISWSTHHSILWALIHGILSWVYVIYYALTR
jgi:hypothetical protein